MKKFSIRTLFVLLLALVLVFSLVACGDKDNDGGNNGGGNTPPTPDDNTTKTIAYFNNLWNLTKGIGGDTITENDNVALHFDMSLALATENTAGKVYQQVDVGFSVDLVLDKTSKDGSATAAKIRVYDPSGNETWFTVYVFMNNFDSIYVDFAGQHVKIPFNFNNDEIKSMLHEFLTANAMFPVGGQNLTVVELIGLFTDDMGPDWDLNKLIDKVVSLTGLDLKSALSGIQGVLDSIGLTQDVLFDAQGKLNLKGILTSDIGAMLFANTTSTTNGDVTTHKTEISSSIIKLLGSFVGDLSNILNESSKIVLSYNEKAGEIDGFNIKVGLNPISAKVDGKTVFPTATITINELGICKATGNDITMETDLTNYKTDVALDLNFAIDVAGIAIDATAMDARNDGRFSAYGNLDNIQLDGKLLVSLKGKVDFANVKNNQTAAVASISYIPANGPAVDVVKASFVGGTLAVTLNQEAKVDGVPVANALVNLFGDHVYNFIADTFFAKKDEAGNVVTDPETGKVVRDEVAMSYLDGFAEVFFADDTHRAINPDFKGAAWKNIDILTPIHNFLNSIFNPGTTTPEAGTAAEASVIKKVADTVKYVLPLISTPDDNFVITLDEINKRVSKIAEVWNSKLSMDGIVDEIVKMDNGNWIPDFKGLLKLAGLTVGGGKDVTAEDIAMFRNVEREKYKGAVLANITVTPEEIAAEKAIAGNENKTDLELTDIIKNKKYAEMTTEQIDAAIVAAKGTNGVTAVRFAGKSDDEVKALIKADRDYLTSVMKGSAKVVLDMSGANGFNVSVEAAVANASVKVSFHFGACAFVAEDYVDLAQGATGAGWYIYEYTAE